jgi:large subunit ribosomal protein L4
MKLKVTDISNKAVGEVEIDDAVFADIFGRKVRKDILARAVNWQLAKRRAGTHKTKEIGDISGTTKKPYAQKGTGNARQGSLRSPQFRGGATIFGPVVRSHAHDLPKKVRKLALKNALSAKHKDGKLVVWGETNGRRQDQGPGRSSSPSSAGPRCWSSMVPEVNTKFALAARNIPNVDVLPQQGANVYDILRRDTLVLTKGAMEHLVERLK